jgi:hypothetical protein
MLTGSGAIYTEKWMPFFCALSACMANNSLNTEGMVQFGPSFFYLSLLGSGYSENPSHLT